jgi:predicted dinucleotide-binding enzyme
MKIAIIGAGRIGGNCAHQAAKAGHHVMLSFARDRAKLESLREEIGQSASIGSPADAVAFGEIVIFSVPWSVIPEALAQAGEFAGKVMIDTTNQFGSALMPQPGQTAAALNAQRMRSARYVKSFNTLTARFQEQAAGRDGATRVVQWVCGDDPAAKQLVGGLIEDMGYVPVDLGGTATCEVMEAPRRPGAVYGEEYRAQDAQVVVEAVQAGAPIPPTPRYE